MPVLIGVDHGTTRTKALAFSESLVLLGEGTVPLSQSYPRPGWVEQDPREVLTVTRQAVQACMRQAGLAGADIAGLGLANQGETVIVWDRRTGAPVYPAISWQDRRTADLCRALAATGCEEEVRRRTGLRLDSYFSAPKIRWILDHVDSGQARAERGELLAGTTDTWLLWNLSRGDLYATDASTASRTLLFNIHALDWDPTLLDLFRIPRQMLPTVSLSAGLTGYLAPEAFEVGRPVPVLGLAVDQQAALFGHGCHRAGMSKVTYGTGAFALMHTGAAPTTSRRGLLTTVAWRRSDTAEYAIDGGVFAAGAVFEWMSQRLGLFETPEASEAIAASVVDSGGVVVVPALAGLAAPYWDLDARAAVLGLTLATTRGHVVRAAFEGIAMRVAEILDAMAQDAGARLSCVRADGGLSRNAALMQTQADVLGIPVEVAAIPPAAAVGAAGLAGLGIGWWTPGTIEAAWRAGARFEPRLSPAERHERAERWRRAVGYVRDWSARGGPDRPLGRDAPGAEIAEM